MRKAAGAITFGPVSSVTVMIEEARVPSTKRMKLHKDWLTREEEADVIDRYICLVLSLVAAIQDR